MDQKRVLELIKSQGYKQTQTRQHIIALFFSTPMPLSYSEVDAYLSTHYKTVNKTTIYRELDFLVAQGLIVAIDLGEGKKRYELADREHHHHLICTSCQDVQDVHIDDNFTAQASTILTQNDFQITRHALEFFGLCGKCRN